MTRTILPQAVSPSVAGFQPHPKGANAKVLLCSVFGPYAQDDEFGSRKINPMELWHNQVTRVQGPFSLRMFHRSWGLMFIQANIHARCTCLDFPTLARFVQELRDNQYDVVGISAILPNLRKVQTMCDLIREHLPEAKIVVGGHITGLRNLDEHIDADHIVRGDGIAWFRKYLGEDAGAPILHPQVWAGIHRHVMGMDLPFTPRDASAALVPSVGCPIGCNFCSTSAMFGGKGHFVSFYPKAEDLFEVMCGLEKAMKMRSFFIMDENFLLQKPRAMGLLELMRRHEKSWALYVFSSANALRMYTMEELVGLGISWVWMGLEGKNSQYGKLDGVDTHELVAQMQEQGIRVLGSTIIGMEEHTPENIDAAIAHAVSHNTDFHQFMLYTPVAGTPLYAQFEAEGRLLSQDEIAFEDTHGQERFNFRHPNFKPGQETGFLLRAFEADYQTNGPSVLRVCRSILKGYQRHKNHPERRIRRRYAWEAEGMCTVYAGALWAGREYFKGSPQVTRQLADLLEDVKKEFGLLARIAAPLIGRFILRKLRREATNLQAGWTQDPPTFYEHNFTPPGKSAGTCVKSVAGRAAVLAE
jgi:hypothetical protein